MNLEIINGGTIKDNRKNKMNSPLKRIKKPEIIEKINKSL